MARRGATRLGSRVLRPGDLAVDATMGNGLDTQFLWHCVQPTGHVLAFGVQARALQQTQQRLLQPPLLLVQRHGNGYIYY